jgi:hypothetical protein
MGATFHHDSPEDDEPLDHTGGHIAADLQSIHQAGTAVRDLGSSINLTPLDRALLTGTAVGHLGLAQALAEFVDVYEQRLDEFARHVTILGESIQRAAHSYRNTDALTTRSLSALRSSKLPLPTRHNDGPDGHED